MSDKSDSNQKSSSKFAFNSGLKKSIFRRVPNMKKKGYYYHYTYYFLRVSFNPYQSICKKRCKKAIYFIDSSCLFLF
jgi:hypothetical protein